MNAEAIDTQSAMPRTRKRSRTLRFVLLVAIPVGLVAAGLWGWYLMTRYASTDDAYVQADITMVSPRASGNVLEVAVRENERVAAGQLLLELQSDDARIAVQRAQAELDNARTEVEALKANYTLQTAEMTLADEQARYAGIEMDRQKDLAEKNLASQSDLDKAAKDYDLMRGLALVVRQQRKQTRIRLAGNLDGPADDHPRVRAALAELERAQLELERSRLRAPRDGVVSHLPKVGDFLAAGAPALSIVSDSGVWIEANFKETDLERMHPGQPVRIGIDTYPGHEWRGRVESIAQATGAQFALLPPQNASGNWVKVVQRIPVRILIEEDPGAPLLRVGMSAGVRVDLGERRLGGFLAKAD
jgi:membrane fusion protein (multidrug efflux system)